MIGARYHVVEQKEQVHHHQRVQGGEQQGVQAVLYVGAAGHSRQGEEHQHRRAHHQHSRQVGNEFRAPEAADQLPQEEAGGHRKPEAGKGRGQASQEKAPPPHGQGVDHIGPGAAEAAAQMHGGQQKGGNQHQPPHGHQTVVHEMIGRPEAHAQHGRAVEGGKGQAAPEPPREHCPKAPQLTRVCFPCHNQTPPFR